ncbi:hypothetical protein AB2L27_19130 [Kineococcus sp. LSe6-4]|uniref:DUF2264 domain-containing protein n=1 Tax=Kineococcus halophytocola TaxID=3234027 RepID=A0ABV4H5L0_9ACTN
MSDLIPPLDLLEAAVTAWSPHLQQDGTLHDPVVGEPTQYGTAYHAWCCAVLADRAGADPVHREDAHRAFDAALRHTADPDAAPHASIVDRVTGSVLHRLNHRDFTWPPLLRTHLALRDPDDPQDREREQRLAGVDVPGAFRALPPSNWAAVWMSGEWLRMRAGLSPTTAEQFDDWLDVFFAGGPTGFDTDLGMYTEPGLPNAYDLFTRVHLLDLLSDGWSGRNRARLEEFLVSGLRRSLAMQVSDGSLASGFRSAGQTWVLGAQVALFTAHRALGLGSAADLEAARLAAWRAYTSLARWQRPGGVFSPVQNVLPPQSRVGYETYTADGHYSPLALAFLASAVRAGFGQDEPPSAAELDDRPATALAEGAPTHRGAAHRGRVSVAVQAVADDTYDASGLNDLTFGAGHRLPFASAVRHLAGGPLLVPGLAVRQEPGAAPLTALCATPRRLQVPLRTLAESGLGFETELLAPAADGGPGRRGPDHRGGPDVTGRHHAWSVQVGPDGIEVSETLAGWTGWRTLLIPYLRDPGTGTTTSVEVTDDGVLLVHGDEQVRVSVQAEVERVTDLPHGFENRRGLCGLVRLDVAGPGPDLCWSVRSPDRGHRPR